VLRCRPTAWQSMYVSISGVFIHVWQKLRVRAPTHVRSAYTMYNATLNFSRNRSLTSRMLVVWRSGSALISINEVNLRRVRLVLGWVTVSGFIPGAGHLSRYVTSHPYQLNLAIPSWVGAVGTSQRAVMPCGFGVKAGMVHVWVAGKTLCALDIKGLWSAT